MNKSKQNGELLFTVFLMLVGVAGFVNTFSWQVLEIDNSGGPALFPRIILGGLFLTSLMRFVQILVEKRREGEKFIFLDLFYGHRGFFLLMFVLYAISIPVLGFLIATVVYLNITVNVMMYFTKGGIGQIKWVIVRFICLTAASIGVFLFFDRALRVMVPTGIFGI